LERAIVVGLNSDRSVRAIKPQISGKLSEPIVAEPERSEVLAVLKPVKAIGLFDEPTATQSIAAL
jgi:D-glycero-beta-D-manno-heptose 1-phosphate adenylyltransferase